MTKRTRTHSRRYKKKKPGFFTKLLHLLLALMLLGIVGAAAAFMLLVDTDSWKDFDPQRMTNVSQTLYVYDIHGVEVAGVYNKENRTPVPLEAIPDHVRNAFISIEDARFYDHKGIDIIRMGGSVVSNLKSMSFGQGFSSISQQLIKNTHLSFEKTINRKVQEMYLTIKLEQEYEKDEILEMYLNFVYFGNGAYGIEAAAHSYFNKSVGDLTVDEGAMLAGIIKAPGNYAPHLDLDRSIQRRNLVLAQMEKYGYLTVQEKEQAQAAVPQLHVSRPNNSRYAQYVDVALDEASQILDMSYENMTSSGFKIYTTMDATIQLQAQQHFTNAELFPESAEDGVPVEGAAIVINAQTGGIKSIIAGREYVAKGMNRAMAARRQPGSAIKPVIVYGPAIDQGGYNGATLINDQPTEFNGYAPRNYGDKYYNWVSTRTAVSKSLNIPAVSVLNDIGVATGIEYAKASGIPFDPTDDHLSLALGGFRYGVTPVELAAAYQPFANGGYYHAPYTITRIEDSYGQMVYEHKGAPRKVMQPSSAFIMADILQSTVSGGTAHRANVDGVPVAGKTGTVSYKSGMGINDAWTVAFTTEDIVVVWNGYDMPSDTHMMPSNATGGRYPAMMAQVILSDIYTNHQPPYFRQPEDVVEVTLDRLSYDNDQQITLANEYTPFEQTFREYFPDHMQPTRVSPYWTTPKTVVDLAITLDPDGFPSLTFTPPQDSMQYAVVRQQLDTMEESLLQIATLDGSEFPINYVDASAAPGRYAYTIIPSNPRVNLGGHNLSGEACPFVTIEVPVPEQEEAPEPSETFTVSTPTPVPSPTRVEPTATPTPEPVESTPEPSATPETTDPSEGS